MIRNPSNAQRVHNTCSNNGNSSIKFPNTMLSGEAQQIVSNGEADPSHTKRQQLINFGHSQWGKNNWSWSVTKQDLDFTDYSNGKYNVGVAAFVTITVNTLGIHRQDVGYATSVAPTKGAAVHQARKSASTNALRETLFGFGGDAARALAELLDGDAVVDERKDETVRNAATASDEPRNSNVRDSPSPPDVGERMTAHVPPPLANPPANAVVPLVGRPPANAVRIPLVARPPHAVRPSAVAPPVASAPPPVRPPPALLPHGPPRRDANVSFLFRPIVSGLMPSVMQPMYGMRCVPPQPPRPTEPFHPAYYECGPWHYSACDGYDGFGGRRADAGRRDRAWIKPTVFYDGFWSERKVEKWASERPEQPEGDAAHSRA